MTGDTFTTVRSAEQRGRALLIGALAVGTATALWLAGAFGPPPGWGSQAFVDGAYLSQGVPRFETGLVPVEALRGKLLFGRHCDSCHTAGLGTSLGSSLRSVQFRREFTSDAAIARRVREGGFDMPGFGKDLISEDDLAALVKFVRELPPVAQ